MEDEVLQVKISNSIPTLSKLIIDSLSGLLALRGHKDSLIHKEIVKELFLTGTKAVNLLAKDMSLLTDKKIYVHIKYFPLGNLKAGEKSDIYRTLCVSDNFLIERRKNINNHAISENTHLKMLVNGLDCFYATDFNKYVEEYNEQYGEKSFKISTEKWREWYKSLMIAPISIKESFIGFLCCDAMEPNAFIPSDIEIYKELILDYSKVLYPYMFTMHNSLKDSD